ncbi:TPA: fimbrial protein [Aeromonas hydrophila]|uniref:fimbrial protein n=1 Tax=Aeromonas TaxID=642 RepID=UPI0009BD52E0|nr:fimbrial protein [Aeromonas caviae]HDZ8915479.1 fimbrial protein [Aeromonas hydrophila]
MLSLSHFKYTLMLLPFISTATYAASCSLSGGDFYVGTSRSVSVTGPEHASPMGKVLGDASEETIRPDVIRCDVPMSGSAGRYSTGQISSLFKKVDGVYAYFDGVRADVFETGVPGVGFSLSATDINAAYINWTQNELNVWADDSWGGALGLKGRYVFVITDALNPGVYNIPQFDAGIYRVYSKQYGLVGAFPMKIPSGKITVSTTTCTLSGGDNESIDFGQIASHGGEQVQKSISRQVICPNDQVKVYFTLSDRSFSGNYGDYLMNKLGDDYAKGVGVQVKFNGNVVPLGPESWSPNNMNQQYLGMGLSQILNLVARPYFIPGEKVIPGKLDATAVLTMSYQ